MHIALDYLDGRTNGNNVKNKSAARYNNNKKPEKPLCI